MFGEDLKKSVTNNKDSHANAPPGVDFLCLGSCSLERHEDCNWISCDEELDYQPNPYQPNMVLSVSVKDKREERGNTNAQQNHVQQLKHMTVPNVIADVCLVKQGRYPVDTCVPRREGHKRSVIVVSFVADIMVNIQIAEKGNEEKDVSLSRGIALLSATPPDVVNVRIIRTRNQIDGPSVLYQNC